MARKAKRIVFRVSYDSKAINRWIVRRGKLIVGRWFTKADAVWWGRVKARASWEVYRKRSQLMIHNRDGTFQTEHTYGEDPRRSKG